MATPSKGSSQAAFSFSRAGSAAPLPGLAASAASRLPRWAIAGLLVLYIGHGLFTREAWRGDDLIAIALMRSAYEDLIAGQLHFLFFNSIGSVVWPELSVVWAALQALVVWPLGQLAGLAGFPLTPGLMDDLARVPTAAALALGFYAIWKATDRLARRREAKPLDPLGVGPLSVDFGKTLGDCALLLSLATLGVVVPWHQSGPQALGFLLQSLFLWALATAPETPKRAGRQIAWLSLAALIAWHAWLAICWCLILFMVFRIAPNYRLVAREFFLKWTSYFLIVIGLWLLAAFVMIGTPLAPFEIIRHQLSGWWLGEVLSGNASWNDWIRWLKEVLWKWWPLWPIALYGIWRSRKASFIRAPHWIVPITSFSVLVVMGFFGPTSSKLHQLLPMAPLAVLAAFGLLSLPRALINLVDWFAVTVFTALGVFIWLYWSALNFGFPETLASRISMLAPGLQSSVSLYEVFMGLLASLAWVVLVAWRVRRGNPRLWRPVVLSAGGLTLLWVLLMTLWLPAIDRMLGQKALASSLELAWVKAAPTRLGISFEDLVISSASRYAIHERQQKRQPSLASQACINPSEQSRALNAMAYAITQLPVSTDQNCLWKLAVAGPKLDLSGWRTVWRSSPSEDRKTGERFLLLERITP